MKNDSHRRCRIFLPSDKPEANQVKTLNEVIESRSPESQQRIKEMADEMILETGLQLLREELRLSQKCCRSDGGESARSNAARATWK